VEHVTGIGGVFLRSRDPAALAAWYAEHLGLDVEDWHGAVLRASGGETLVWAAFPSDTEYFGRHDQHTRTSRFGWGTEPEGNRFELWQPVAGQ
jgi:catechol 2,3-dioxygenase-like lactoylglutathione lyase family enzyme